MSVGIFCQIRRVVIKTCGMIKPELKTTFSRALNKRYNVKFIFLYLYVLNFKLTKKNQRVKDKDFLNICLNF